MFAILKRIPVPTGRSLVLYLAGFACLGLTALMNLHAGVSQAATEQGRQLLGAASIIIDVIGLVVIGSVAGNLLGMGKRGLGALMLSLTILSGIYSMGSILTFVATEWLSVAESRKAAIQLARDKQDEERRLREERLKLQAQTAQAALQSMQATVKDATSRKERKILSDGFAKGANEVISTLGKEQTAAAAPAPAAEERIQLRPDAGAEAVQWITTLPEKTYQVIRMGLISCLLIAFKMALFPLAGYYQNRRREGMLVDLVPFEDLPMSKAVAAPATAALALPPPALAKTEPAPLPKEATKLLNEPSPEWRLLLDAMEFPRKKGLKELQRKQHPREQIGWRWFTWLVAHGHTGDYTATEVEKLYDSFCDSDYPRDRWGLNVAKGELRTAGKKWITVRDSKSPTMWTIQMPKISYVRDQLVKRKVITGNAPVAAEEAAKVDPKKGKPEEAGGGARVVPFEAAGGASAEAKSPPAAPANDDTPLKRGPIKGLGELQRLRPDLDGLRRLEREQKRQWQARSWQQHRKQLNRFSRARAA